jgi:Protein of unknown function (DUF2934)
VSSLQGEEIDMAIQRHKQRNAPNPSRLTINNEELYERVARKAYELYQQRGEEPGHEFDDWLTAERLVQEELRHGPPVDEPILEEENDTEGSRVPP